MIEYRPETGVFRAVDKPGGPFRASARAIFVSPEFVILTVAMRENERIRVQDFRDVLRMLKQMGVTRVKALRHGQEKEYRL